MITEAQLKEWKRLAGALRAAREEHCRDGGIWPFDDMGEGGDALSALIVEVERLREKVAEYERRGQDTKLFHDHIREVGL